MAQASRGFAQGTNRASHCGQLMCSKSMRRILSGVMACPQFGQVVVSDALTFSRSTLGFDGNRPPRVRQAENKPSRQDGLARAARILNIYAENLLVIWRVCQETSGAIRRSRPCGCSALRAGKSVPSNVRLLIQ